MKPFQWYVIFTAIGFIICLLFGPAAALGYGVIVVLANLAKSESRRMKTRQGREQMQREREREAAIEKEFGTVNYWKDKKSK